MKHSNSNTREFRDFFYDKNDIFLALIILIVAAGLIFWRVNSIMNYPQTLAEETNTTKTTEEQATSSDTTAKEEAKEDSKTTSNSDKTSEKNSSSTSVLTDGKLTKEVTLKISGGSATAAVQQLVDAGLFKSYDEYASVCKAAGYTPENIKATTYTFAVGSTQTDIAKKVTQ